MREIEPEHEARWAADTDRNLASWIAGLDLTMVMEIDGEPAGYETWAPKGGAAVLTTIHVFDGYRRAGRGARLLRTFISDARTHGFTDLALGVHRNNPAHRPGGIMSVRCRIVGRGNASTRSGRWADQHDAHLPGLGRWWRIQRRPRATTVFRIPRRPRHRARGERRRTIDRRLHPPRRCRHQLGYRWIPYDGVGRATRNGLNFTERGFGARGGERAYSDRGHTAASQLRPGDIDWESSLRGVEACVGSTPAASSPRYPTQQPTSFLEATKPSTRLHGTIVSYDLNYRPSLWR